MPTPSAHYSYSELEGLWISGGGPARLAPVMAAVAMAESGGSALARNPHDNNGTQTSYGLWQISNGTHSPPSMNWSDPLENARLAVQKWKSQGLGAWGTYTSGLYKRFLKRGVQPTSPGGGLTPKAIPYANPFRSVHGLTPERIDMGVDYAGQGPVYALGPGRITAVNRAWAGGVGAVGPGTWITERLTAGPLRGRQVYVAENITPSVRVGQQVSSQTVIGRLTGQGAGLETGLAAPGAAGQQGETLAAQLGQASTSGDPGAVPTAAGVAYSNLLTQLGAPSGVGPQKGGTGSTAPGWPPPWLVGILGGIDKFLGGTGSTGSGLPGIGGIGGAIQNIANWLNGLNTAIDWLVNPANWVRIIAGVGGGIFVISGVVVLSHVGGQVPIPYVGGSVSARPAALPVGILLVGAGGVGLFIAFHNLPGSPANVGELLGSLRDQAQATSQQQVAA